MTDNHHVTDAFTVVHPIALEKDLGQGYGIPMAGNILILWVVSAC